MSALSLYHSFCLFICKYRTEIFKKNFCSIFANKQKNNNNKKKNDICKYTFYKTTQYYGKTSVKNLSDNSKIISVSIFYSLCPSYKKHLWNYLDSLKGGLSIAVHNQTFSNIFFSHNNAFSFFFY